MQTNNDFKRKADEKSNFSSSFLRRTVTAVLCFTIVAVTNVTGDEKIKAYTSAFGRALRNNAFGLDSVSSVKAAAERLYRMIPSDRRAEEETSEPRQDNDVNDTDIPVNGVTFQ